MRRLPPSPLINTILYDEITSAGDVAPAWPGLPPGCSAEYELVQAPAGSSATASLSGLLADADLPGAYILQRSAVWMGQTAARDFAVVYWPALGEDVSAPTSPSRVELPAGSTNSGTVTWTHSDPPADPVYTLSVVCVTDGTTVTPSGSGLSWSWAVETGKAYVASLTCTSGDFSQPATPLAVVIEDYTALSWVAPAAAAVAAGNTSAVLTWTTPTGGQEPYEYSDPGPVYDSQGSSTTVAWSTAGAGAGATTVSGLVNGQTVVLQRTVTDADGTPYVVQGAVTVAATAAGVTAGAAPAGQALAAGTTNVTIGTWGAASGGTAPYSYVLTETSGSGVTISGSGLGPYTAAGLVDGQTYVFLLTITDAALVKGYSVVTVSVSPSSAMGRFEVSDECDFTDADWTAMSSTNATASTSAWQHTLYAADGVTPRAYVSNNSTQARTLSLSPSGSGLTLVNGTSAASPNVTVWPAGWSVLLGASRRDAWIVEAVLEGEEPAGVGGFVHTIGIVASQVPQCSAGVRVINTGSNTRINAVSYISAIDEVAVATVTAGGSRLWSASVQMGIADFRRHPIYVNVGATDYRDPQTGLRVQAQQASTTMSTLGGDNTTSAAWGASTIAGRCKLTLYHDGTATSGSAVRLKKLRLLRMPLGSF